MISAAAMAAYARMFGASANPPTEIAEPRNERPATDPKVAQRSHLAAPRPIPTAKDEAHLTPWERAWARLRDDEKTWSST